MKRPPKVQQVAQPLVVLPLGTDQKTVAMVRAAGYVPILTDVPEKVKIILPGVGIESGSDFLMAALHGLNAATQYAQGAFFEELHRRLKEREAVKTKEQQP